jgi:hypothetical protein
MMSTAIFEYIADAGYTAYIKELEQFNSKGVKLARTTIRSFRKLKQQRKKYDAKGRLVEIITTHSFLIPKLSIED